MYFIKDLMHAVIVLELIPDDGSCLVVDEY